jgi:hypothetical protein
MFADGYHVAETMTRHRSQCHGSRPIAIVQARGVTVLPVQLAFATAYWLMCGEPNKVKIVRPIVSTK